MQPEDKKNYFANYTDDTTPCIVGSTTADVLENLPSLTEIYFSWFTNNQMKGNYDKCI